MRLSAISFAVAFCFAGQLNLQAQCGNPIVCENALTGNPQSEWDVVDAGDPTIQGFSTDISVNRGQTVNFKITTTAPAYRIDIYRLGYYGGRGARKITSITPTASLAQNQPACLSQAATGLLDCGNWRVSSSWAVPANATSGVYIARLVRTDTGGASHITFIVRDDTGGSDILFQTSDPTWQAYNTWGGNSLYEGTGPGRGLSNVGRAYKVSYNRPDNTRTLHDGLLTFEHPLIRWMEANGYNISYASGVDTDRRGPSALGTHKVFVSVGHDEYWSGGQRASVEAARGAGVNLAFFSGNLMFWKTRWESSIDGTNTPYRTLVCYKETHEGAKIDPTSTWTGTWRDPRFSPPSDGARPENAVSGLIFTVNAWRYDPIRVSSEEGRLRFWRNTGLDILQDGEVGELPAGILGNEWDEALDNGFQPTGLFGMSTTTLALPRYLLDYGSLYGPGLGTHRITMYRHNSGALVFAAGTEEWSWALDNTHDVPGPDLTYVIQHPGPPPDRRVQQATVNLFADMHAQPLTLQPGLVTASASTDTLPPTSAIVSLPSLNIPAWTQLTIYGTAIDLGGGRTAGVDLSNDGGATWHPVTGTAKWNATVQTAGPGILNIKTRAVDDSGLIEAPGSGVNLVVTGYAPRYTLWDGDTIPATVDEPDARPVELGVRFKSSANGWISALRFYKSSANTGIHIGNLWTNSGTRLATATFTGETVEGWQEVQLSPPIPITAGATYVASYHTDAGHYSDEMSYLTSLGVERPPLSSPVDSVGAPNGIYVYGDSAFPNTPSQGNNYWVDVVFRASLGVDSTAPVITSVAPTPNAVGVGASAAIIAKFNEAMSSSSISSSTFILKDGQNNLVAASVIYDPITQTARVTPATGLLNGIPYTATAKGGVAGVSDISGNKLAADYVWTFTTNAQSGPFTLWPPSATPLNIDEPDSNPVELGVRFQADSAGWITALRFYKSAANTGPHVGNLWSANGTLLASVTFTNETASGWQEAQLPTPFPVNADSAYVASYHTNTGHYSDDVSYFSGRAVNRPPLSAPADGAAGANGVFGYGPSAFPTNTAQSTNYWVDVVFYSSFQTASPTFNPPAGSYSSGQLVTISDATPGSQIYFTTNGSAPTGSSTRYTAPISVSATTTVKAIAVSSASGTSPVATAIYTIQANQTAPPGFNPGGGTYSASQAVVLTDTTPGASIYYTTNGSTPTTSSTRYTGPVTVSVPLTIKALATAPGFVNSSVASATYGFQAATPVANPAGGTYTTAQTVMLSSATSGASVYYTTDGSTPTTGSTRYSSPVNISATTTLNAIAAVSGWTSSAVSTNTYTISLPSRPSAPSGLTATAASAGQVDLAWTDAATNETGYKIERKTGTGGTYAQIATAAANATSYSDFTASASTTYVYRLRATNSAGDSAYSNEATVTTPAPAGPPAPWVHGDIGTTGATGSATYINGTFTVKGAGADIWGTADGFRFVYQSLTGNGEIVARVASVQNTNAWAKAGVMIRETTAANSRNVLMAVTPGNGLAFQSRASAGGSSTSVSGPAVTAPYWVRLIRSGSTFTGYGSSNGTSWTQVGTATISMANTVQIGLALTSHSSGTLNTSVFDSVAVGTQLGTPTGLTATAASSSQINLSWVDNSTGETGFKIERKIGSGGTYAQITTVGAGVTTYSDPALGSGTTYFYRIRATNATGDSAYSAEASATTSVQAPPVPGGLAASAVSSTQINLSWNDVSGESGFKIERKTGPSGTYTQIATVGAGIVTYNNTGLVVNTTYYYRVRATNSGGDSGYSAEVNATTLNAAPAAPSGLVATAASTTQINLTWVDNSTNETGFRIERNAGGSYVEITTVGAGITSFADTGLSPGTTYLYRVRATNALGDSAYTAVASATTLAVPPSMPTGLVATAVSSTQINLTWADVATETGFKLERKTGSGGTYAQIANVGANVTNYSDSTLSANTTYFYRIRATNSGGDSAYSAEASATTLSASPAAPAGLAASTISSTQINLSWSDVSNETGFKIERKTGSGGTYAQIATVGANVTSYSNTSLTAGTTYFYRIRATNAVGDSAYSNEVSATTSSAVPAAPAGLVATPVSATQINLSWSDVANETNFKIERKTGSGGTYAQIATTGANVTSYSNTGLTGGTTYFYRVRANNAAGDSGYSSEVSAFTIVPTFRGASSKGATSGVLTLNISKPTGTQSGDVMVAAVAVRPSTATITASGWTLVRRTNNTTGNSSALAVYYKVAGTSEPTSYAFGFNTSVGSAGGIRAFSGVNTSSPVDVDAGQNTANGLNHTAPSVTTHFANDMIVTSHELTSSARFGAPSGMTEAFDVASDGVPSSAGVAMEGCYQLRAAIGATGALTATASGDADTGCAHTLALKSK